MSDAERRTKELDNIIKRYNIRLDNENSELKRGLKEKAQTNVKLK
jgi:hypothetical protein